MGRTKPHFTSKCECVRMCALFTHRSTGMKMELNKMEWHRIEPTNIFRIHTIHTAIRHTKSNHHQFDIINRQQSVFNFISITCTRTHTRTQRQLFAHFQCVLHISMDVQILCDVYSRGSDSGAHPNNIIILLT